MPARAASSDSRSCTSPTAVSTPGLLSRSWRESARTVRPPATSSGMRREPMCPVAPVTRTVAFAAILHSLRHPFAGNNARRPTSHARRSRDRSGPERARRRESAGRCRLVGGGARGEVPPRRRGQERRAARARLRQRRVQRLLPARGRLPRDPQPRARPLGARVGPRAARARAPGHRRHVRVALAGDRRDRRLARLRSHRATAMPGGSSSRGGSGSATRSWTRSQRRFHPSAPGSGSRCDCAATCPSSDGWRRSRCGGSPTSASGAREAAAFSPATRCTRISCPSRRSAASSAGFSPASARRSASRVRKAARRA